MEKRIISPAAINALIEALASIYHYKRDLRNFITNTISNHEILVKLNWEDYKRTIASNLVNFLNRNQETYQDDLLKLMTEVCKITDFSHLERLDDGKEKARNAKQSVNALKKQMGQHEDIIKENIKINERRQKATVVAKQRQNFQEKLYELNNEYCNLIGSTEAQKRGFKLEKIMKDLFSLFDLDPKASFRVIGLQIDGAFTFDGTDYLFESKWEKNPAGFEELSVFNGKLTGNLDNTLGLFLSINGFSDEGIRAYSKIRPNLILMDGSDLMAVLEGRIDFKDLLLRKRRHASQTGDIYLKINDILSN
ncbi:MAG: hypothetical protein ACYCT7_01480 [bacterium]